MKLKPLGIHIFAILLSAFKYKHKIAYAVIKMIVHKAKKENCKQAYQTGIFTPEKYCTFHMKQ